MKLATAVASESVECGGGPAAGCRRFSALTLAILSAPTLQVPAPGGQGRLEDHDAVTVLAAAALLRRGPRAMPAPVGPGWANDSDSARRVRSES